MTPHTHRGTGRHLRRLTLLLLLVGLCFGLCLEASGAGGRKKKRTAVRRPKVGLVLGGGGAKGAAEVGVLKYIEQSGVKIDYIAGTSIGSIIGALYSVGYRAADLDSLFHSQQWISLLTDRDQQSSSRMFTRRDSTLYVFGFPVKHAKNPDPQRRRTVGLSHGDSIVSLFTTMTRRRGDINFDRLPIPFRCVAVDLRERKEVVLRRGNLPKAMRASMAIPGVFKPVEQDSMLLVDGGMLNNLPVDVVKAMGADIVIAVDLTQNKRKKSDWKGELWQSLRGKNEGLGAVLSWVLTRPDLNKYEQNVRQADLYINPELRNCSAADFKPKKIDYMIKQGEKAGKAALKALKKIKKQQ